MLRLGVGLAVLLLLLNANPRSVGAAESHAPMRPLPAPSDRPLEAGPAYYVDADRGDDGQPGSREQPWRTLAHALPRLSPGDTLYLRGGIYYEHVEIPVSGRDDAPVTIRGYPGELAIIDGGLREFHESPATAWKPLESGDEYVSARRYPQFRARPIVTAFPAAGWEPFFGKESQRPVVLGHFADSMVPLHGYRTRTDLRDTSMLWDVGGKHDNEEGVYCGPGLWYNRASGRIHIRLAPTSLSGLGQRRYRGETDPRRIPLCISGPYGADVLRINGVQHVRLLDLVLRGASGSPLINMYGADHVTFEGITAFGGSPGLLAKASSHVRIVDCAFRGLAAPWSSRASMKYRGTPSYRIITQRNKPENHDWEIAYSEFTDDHDGLWLRYVRNLKFHHNLVDHFNDDGVEVGARKWDHALYIYQNLISRCLLTFTLHEMDTAESPPEVQPGSGVYITRNVIDLRQGVFRAPPRPAGDAAPSNGGRVATKPAGLLDTGTLCGDHGSPTWPNYYFYQNTVLRHEPAWRGYYGFGIGGRATRDTTRRVLNNIFVQLEGLPGLNFASGPDDNFVDGNLHWSVQDGPGYEGDFLAQRGTYAFRRAARPKGWMAHDLFADPAFAQLSDDPAASFDVTLRSGSPAVGAGVPLPDDWFDPLRDAAGEPHVGAIPPGRPAWSVGVGGRIRIGAP